jgi:hypothetical protein
MSGCIKLKRPEFSAYKRKGGLNVEVEVDEKGSASGEELIGEQNALSAHDVHQLT